MDENQSTGTQTAGGSKKNWIIIAVVVIALILLVAAGGYYYMNSQNQNTVMESQTPSPEAMEEGTSEEESMSEPQSSNYQDGTYNATGTYSYHSGTEQVRVTVTLESGVVTDAQVVSLAKAPTSKTMQADFIANFEPQVVGKNLDEVEVGKVSGSSLTGIGFTAALDDIKTQAQG